MEKNTRVGRLQRLLARLTSNREELQHLEPSRARFEALFARIQEVADQQALYTASKQEATQQLKAHLTEAERLATILQLAVKQHYGIRAEKLADFGLQPFRGRARKTAPGLESPEKPGKPAAVATDPS